MKRLLFFVLVLLCALPLAARGGMKKISSSNAGKKIAVVSLSANNYGNSLQGWNSVDTTNLMVTRMNSMLKLLELNLAADWTVIPAESFVAKEEYQRLSGEDRQVGVPEFKGARMRLFGKNRKDMIKAKVDAETIKKLADVSGAEFLLVIYSEWDVATGKMVPTSKAFTKNVMALYDSTGKQVFAGRYDQMGRKTLGMSGVVVVDENTIDEWVGAFNEAVKLLLTN